MTYRTLAAAVLDCMREPLPGEEFVVVHQGRADGLGGDRARANGLQGDRGVDLDSVVDARAGAIGKNKRASKDRESLEAVTQAAVRK